MKATKIIFILFNGISTPYELFNAEILFLFNIALWL